MELHCKCQQLKYYLFLKSFLKPLKFLFEFACIQFETPLIYSASNDS